MGRIIPYIMEILVNGKDYFMENKSNVWNHQPDRDIYIYRVYK